MNLPSAIPEELCLIGCCLSGGIEAATDVSSRITAEMFLDDNCREAFEIVAGIVADGSAVDTVSFYGAWKKRFNTPPPESLIESPDKVPSPANWPYYAESVADAYQRRRIILEADRLQQAARDTSVPIADTLARLSEFEASPTQCAAPSLNGRAFGDLMCDDLEARQARQGQLTGIATGFGQLDGLISGLQAQEQFIVGARPSVGKTALAVCVMAKACLEDGIPTLFASFEMSAAAIARRMCAAFAGVPLKHLRDGMLTEIDFARATEFRRRLSKAPFYFLDAVGGMTASNLALAIRRHTRKHGLKLVVVDYLQKITPNAKSEKRTYEVGGVSGALKAAAVSNNVALLTLAQLSREPDKDKGRLPRLSDLADSAQIERDADCVGLLHRPRTKDNPQGTEASLLIAKQRDGELGNVPLYFDGEHCRFTAVAND